MLYENGDQNSEECFINPGLISTIIQGVSKKMSFSGKTAITTFKLIQNANVGGVLESSGNLLHYGH